MITNQIMHLHAKYGKLEHFTVMCGDRAIEKSNKTVCVCVFVCVRCVFNCICARARARVCMCWLIL